MSYVGTAAPGSPGERKLIFRQGAFLLAFSHQVKSGIVVVFGLVARVVGHEAEILAGLGGSLQSSVFGRQRTFAIFAESLATFALKILPEKSSLTTED